MIANKFEIKRFSAETKKRPRKGDLFNIACNDLDPETIKSFKTRKEALEALKEYKSSARFMQGFASYYYIVDAYAVESYEADADGELIEGSDYDPAEEDWDE